MRSVVVSLWCLSLLVACKPFEDDLDMRAIEYIKILVTSPDDAVVRRGEIAKCDTVSVGPDEQSARIALQYLWARHQQGVGLRYLQAEKRLLQGGSQVITIVVQEGDRKVLGRNAASYYFDVYFEQESSGQWCLTRVQMRP